MALFGKASPAVVEILNKLQRAEIPTNFDHNLYEYGSVRYNIQASESSPQIVNLSIWMPPIYLETASDCLPNCTIQDIRNLYLGAAELVEPPKQGFMITLRINFSQFPKRKEARMMTITEISSIQSVILSLQLKDMLCSLKLKDVGSGICRPVKIVYQPREPFFVIKMPEKVTVIYPMRFKDDSDVVLATSFFQELVDVSNSAEFSKAPRCTWSPIPPPELRRESFQNLTTNGGFVSFEIFSQQIKVGAKGENTVRNLLTFIAYVKYHVKCTRSFIQRKMRQRQESLSEIIRNARIGGYEDNKKDQGLKHAKKWKNFSKSTIFKGRYGMITNQIKKFNSGIRIKLLLRLRRQWLKIPLLRKHRKSDSSSSISHVH
ncbi:actin-related protein 2/3 complex subunit 2B-like [Zingiber officinale]|uniref:actin-related protein 2/3 complex subunit 2B-like n=1 Tax=Zingiber officinale TaxID=94328 RepID=UPI001C4A99F6|nr:actin-related protein 2/3 complex subunit 2B-like [Zingiber officinale]XP_042378031.1 actin-related protein 2/3 complex subunit 2B-like [Zingiber officinale]